MTTTWNPARITAQFAQPAPAKRTARAREDLVLLRRDLERILEERGDATPWRLREALDRARRFIPPVGDPDRWPERTDGAGDLTPSDAGLLELAAGLGGVAWVVGEVMTGTPARITAARRPAE